MLVRHSQRGVTSPALYRLESFVELLEIDSVVPGFIEKSVRGNMGTRLTRGFEQEVKSSKEEDQLLTSTILNVVFPRVVCYGGRCIEGNLEWSDT